MIGNNLVINLYDKTRKNINEHIDNPIQFINDNINKQDEEIVYLYSFSGGGGKYLVVNSPEENVIEKVTKKETIPIIWSTYGPERSTEELKDSILQKLSYVSKKNYNKIITNEELEKYREFLNKISNDEDSLKKVDQTMKQYVNYDNINNSNSEEIVQQGGILFWLIDKYVFGDSTSTLATIWRWFLEIVDIVIFAAASIPGLQAAAFAGFILDALTIIWCFLRFDILGMVAGIVSIIPVIGDIGAIPIKVFSKLRKVGKASKYASKARKAYKKSKTAARLAKYGRKVKKYKKAIQKSKSAQKLGKYRQKYDKYKGKVRKVTGKLEPIIGDVTEYPEEFARQKLEEAKAQAEQYAREKVEGFERQIKGPSREEIEYQRQLEEEGRASAEPDIEGEELPQYMPSTQTEGLDSQYVGEQVLKYLEGKLGVISPYLECRSDDCMNIFAAILESQGMPTKITDLLDESFIGPVDEAARRCFVCLYNGYREWYREQYGKYPIDAPAYNNGAPFNG